MSHLDDGTLHALLDGEIPSAELPPIQAHLSACPACRARLESERALMEEADGLVELIEVPDDVSPAVSRPQTVRRSGGGWLRGLAWAASVVGAAGLGYAVRAGRSSGPEPEVLAVTSNPAAPAGDPAASSAKPGDRQETPPPPPAPGLQPTNAPERRQTLAPPPAGDDRAAAERVRDSAVVLAKADTFRTGELAAKAADDRRAVIIPSSPAEAANRQETGGRGAGALGRLDRERGRNPQPASGAAALDAAASRLALAEGPEPVTFPEALRRLNGSLRLIPGMVPIRLETQGPLVRVVYATAHGELVLSQSLRDGQIVFTLESPPGFPTDSLARLRARVRE